MEPVYNRVFDILKYTGDIPELNTLSIDPSTLGIDLLEARAESLRKRLDASLSSSL